MDAKEFFSFFLPPDSLRYFDMVDIEVKEGKEKYMGQYGFDDEYTVVLVEKEILPEDPRMYQDKKIRTKGYNDITLEDFPIRGRKTRLRYRVRKWQVEGEKGIIQRKLEISAEGVRYTGEFAFFFEEGIETNAEDISSIANRYKTGSQKLRRAYKENISEFKKFNEKHKSMFEEEAFVFPENIGPNMGIDETGLMNGELYTIFYNKDGKGKKGSLAAIIKGVKASTVVGAIEKYAGVSQLYSIREVSLDLSMGMDWIARELAPNAMKTIDRFHVEQLITEAVQQVRIKYRWEAIDKENELLSRKGDKQIHRLVTYSNGDTERQLLSRSRGLLFKQPYQWTEQQKKRAAILFEEFPLIKKAHEFYVEFKKAYRMSRLQAEFHLKDWIEKVKRSGLIELTTAAQSIKSRLGGILNYLENRSTNAAVENFNRKLKTFLSRVRGVNDNQMFFYRLIKLYA